MGSQPSNTAVKAQDAIIKPEAIDSKFFDAQVQKMKYVKKQDKIQSIKNFKQKSDETQLALSFALVNLKKNHLLSTGQFLHLQGSGNRDKKLPNKRQLKSKQMNMLRKISQSKGELLFPEVRYNYNYAVNDSNINSNSTSANTNINAISNLKSRSNNTKTEAGQHDYANEPKQYVKRKFSIKKVNQLKQNRNSQANLSKNSMKYLNSNFRTNNASLTQKNPYQNSASHKKSLLKLNNYLAVKQHKISQKKFGPNPQYSIAKIQIPKWAKNRTGSPKYI